MTVTVTVDDVLKVAPEFSSLVITEVQVIEFSGVPATGDVTVTYGADTAVLDGTEELTAAYMQTQLRTLDGLEDVVVTGNLSTGFEVEFIGVDGDADTLAFSDSTLQAAVEGEEEEGADVTVEAFEVIKGTEGEDILNTIELAREFVCESKWGTEAKAIKAICLMTAHLLKTLGFGAGNSSNVSGPITSERVGDLARSYGQISMTGSAGDQLLTQTKYGQTFLMLRKTLLFTPMVV